MKTKEPMVQDAGHKLVVQGICDELRIALREFLKAQDDSHDVDAIRWWERKVRTLTYRLEALSGGVS